MHPNYVHLAQRFADRLLAERPASVFDVGCGNAFVVGRCFEAGVPAAGVDPSRKRLGLVRDVGFPVARARAWPLPVRTGGADWVAIRHVLHHLPDMRAAMAEAVRVARTGLLLAEPWFDTRLPSQRASQRADNWLKRQDDKHGHPHRPALDPHEILALLPAGLRHRWEIEHYFRPYPMPLDRWRERSGRWLGELPDGHPEAAEHRTITADLERHGLTDCGTVLVTVRLGEPA